MPDMNNKKGDNKQSEIAGLIEQLNYLHQQNKLLVNRVEQLEKANRELAAAKKKAEESDKLKTAFLQNMSHEIRTPMNGILGFAELLSNPELSSDERQAYINIVTESGDRMLNTFNNLMEVSMIETGNVSLNYSVINLNGEFGDLYADFRDEAKRKNLAFSFYSDLPDNEANIYTDREKLSSILSHLLKNAVKYSNSGGAITFGYVKKNDVLEFYVKDQGIGIPKERLQAIFDKFTQADIEDKNAMEGSGLGLTVAKAYVELLGGTIWVHSTENRGTTFYFTIPFTVRESDMNDKTTPVISIKSNKPKILIAEDEPFTKDYLTIILQNMSSEILYVDNGLDAVTICRKNPDIDLVLMDIKMPVMNGYEATREIRKFNNEIFIIAQTAYALASDREKALEAGCNDYISKPINREELVMMIENVIP